MSTSNSSENRAGRLIWIDLEMSGLDPDKDIILEAALIVTDSHLNIVQEWPSWAIAAPDAVLDNMDAWNTRTHTASGLIERCRSSELTAESAERHIIKILKKYVDKKASPMCGNSVCQDRRFLARAMPALEDFFHYRNFDVSSFKIAAQMYYPAIAEAAKNNKPAAHQALDDIRASIEEMRYYRKHMLVDPD